MLNNMRGFSQLKENVEKIVKEACYSEKNEFGSTVWEYHILPVVNHSLTLGKKLGADLEILELAALLHDIAAITNCKNYPDHHIKGAQKAEQILGNLNVETDKLEQIKHCILSHRGSRDIERKTLEAQIVASADAMSHITELADMFYLTFGIHKYGTAEGSRWLKEKLERSWGKIMPEGRIIVEDDFRIANEILKRAIEKNI